jgi:hypothetical protein
VQVGAYRLAILYDDGTPRTHHVTTNVIVDVVELAGTVTARSSVTVLQAVSDLPLQPIAAGRYRAVSNATTGGGASRSAGPTSI